MRNLLTVSFAALLAAGAAHAQRGDVDPHTQMQDQMRMDDRNMDGSVSYDEARDASGGILSEVDFDLFDSDEDGSLNSDEYAAYYNETVGVDGRDAAGDLDRRVSFSDAREAADGDLTREEFSEYDANDDGWLNRNEVAEWREDSGISMN